MLMENTNQHYRLLLGLDDSWDVVRVNLSLEEKRVEIFLEYVASGGVCPECGSSGPLADHASERKWRHLDTMQFETILIAKTPRTQCSKCGVKTMTVPWAEKHSRFTVMFEALAIEVIKACGNVKAAAGLLGLQWKAVHRIMDRAVQRGMDRRETDSVENVGIDEKSFRRGHNYISLLTDIDGSRVLEVSEGRDEAAANRLWNSLSSEKKGKIKAVAVDMWQAYLNSIRTNAPQAAIVHDRFHVSKYLNDAVDKVRRQEHKKLKKEGEESPLTGSKQLWLFNPENFSESQSLRFSDLKDLELKTSRAWAIKEHFRWFWNYRYTKNAEKSFRKWYGWAARSRLKPIVDVAKTFKSHLDNLLTYFRHPITNAKSEGFNSRIQSIKSNARGFRSFDNYRTRILFYCGKLKLLPEGITH
jgi:transposase